ncbi:MAG: hypothetical protein ACYTKD_18860 [Planctomycetota bacterium]|jgi:hypothetical protein
MTDERIRAVLARAAEDRTFFDALIEDRESALGAFDLSPEEKALLMAPADKQLAKMIEQARKKPWSNIARAGFFVGGVAAAAGFTGVLVAPCFATLGHTAEPVQVASSSVTLSDIAAAESLYLKKHGRYGTLDELVRAHMIFIPRDSLYLFVIELDGDTFTATARHRTRPDTRPAFRVGPDGQVKRVE